jgi:hypothetical protein
MRLVVGPKAQYCGVAGLVIVPTGILGEWVGARASREVDGVCGGGTQAGVKKFFRRQLRNNS